jgi:pyruvate, water dikinase
MSYTRFFTDLTKNDVAIAGGKGASLGEMTSADIPVPPGFVVLAPAFDQFLRETDLTQEVEAQLDKVNYEDIASVDRASRVIGALIQEAAFPKDLEEEVMKDFATLGAELVAVRSSATAEDSSAASWAGELESYLNTTQENLLENIKRCWASLFTPRAIVYRNEKGLRRTHVSVAVVVQKMVQSEIAGISFTVHPVTKDTNQMIIEACWGLGEFIVGGIVTPDSYVIDKRDGTLIDVNVAEQEEMLTRSERGNQKIAVPAEKKAAQKLEGKRIKEIGDICIQIEKHYGFPCDIEWGFEAEKFYIVQSRPITTL